MATRTLIFIPTYNERENVESMASQILAQGLDADLLFLDDGSPDGTGQVLAALAAREPRVRVTHRSGKLGVGSAHLHGIAWAYDHGYETLITDLKAQLLEYNQTMLRQRADHQAEMARMESLYLSLLDKTG